MARKTTRRTTAAAADEAAGPAVCVSNFVSPFQRRVLPREFGDQLRALGLEVNGPVAAGYFPGGFLMAAADQPFGATVEPDAAWGRGATIRVGFLDRNPTFEAAVREYVRLWSEAADVKFEFATSPTSAQVRITFRQTNSFYSLLGREVQTVPSNQHTMSLGFRGNEPDTEYRRLVLHEFGHSLGFHHEHQNPAGGIQWDWPRAVAYYRRRLPPTMTDQQIIDQLKALPNSSRYKFTEFDPASIMEYQIPQEAVRPGTWRPEFARNNTELSATDRRIAAELYGPGTRPPGDDDGTGGGSRRKPPEPARPRKLTIDGAALSDSITDDGEVDRFTFRVRDKGVYTVTTSGDAIVRVTLADEDFQPIPDYGPADSISPRHGVEMPLFLKPADYSLLVAASKFSPNTRGDYTIKIVSE